MKRLLTSLSTLLFSSFVMLTGSASGQVTIYTEEFDYPTGELPPDWILQAEQTPPWSVSATAIAGGSAPELNLGYSFAAGTSRLISPSVNIEGYSELAFKFKQYLINYEMDWGEVIGIDVTFDSGENWHALWEGPLGLLNIPQDEFGYYFNSPEGATEMQFAFRYVGNSNAINRWAIDDITIESVADNDLLAARILGTTTPNAGEETVYFVQVLNGGRLTQDDYTVNLMTEDGVELASVAGQSIAFTENKYHLLSWTPTTENVGSHTVHVYVDFAQDQIPANNHSKDLIVNVQPENTENVQIGNGSVAITGLP